MGKRVLIIIYSKLRGNSQKGPQLEVILDELKKNKILEKAFGVCSLKNKRTEKLNEYESKIPTFFSGLVKRIKFFKDYNGYLIGELITGLLYKNKIKKSKANIVCLKPRPLNLVKEAKKQNKIVILDPGEMDPLYTKKTLQEEQKILGIMNNSMYSNKFATSQFRKALTLSDYVIALSEKSKQSYIEYGLEESKIKVINLGMEKKYGKKSKKMNKNQEIEFVTTASHSILKGTHRLLNVWEELNLNSKLYIIGDVRSDLKEYIGDKKFKNVKFLGSMKKEEILKFYESKNLVGVLNSFSEGFPRVVVEYLSRSLPVIVTEVATCDYIKSGETGEVIEEKNDIELKKAILRIYNNQNLYKNYSEEIYRGYNRWMDDYGREIVSYMKNIKKESDNYA